MTEEEFKSKVLPFKRDMLECAVGILHDRDATLDCLQDALASLWSHRDNLMSITNLRAYCITTMRNTAIASIRRNGKITLCEIPDSILTDDADATEAGEKMRILGLALKSLNETQRRIVLMSTISGMSGDEIASALGLSATNVRTILYRSRSLLRDFFHRYYS